MSASGAPVVVVGAGPAGLSCTRRLVAAGLNVLLVDDNDQPGGQYLKQLPPGVRGDAAPIPRPERRTEALFAVLSHPAVTYLPETCVWAQDAPMTLAYAGPGRSGRVTAAAIVVAAGAQDRPLPFPGWTLPGVITAGGCLNLIKGQGMVPGRRVAVVGNGPLLLVAANALTKARARVAVVAEAVRSRGAARHLGGLLRSPALLAKGMRYRAAMLRSGTPFLGGHLVVAAEGVRAVTGVVVAPRRGGTVDGSRARRFEIDALVTGYGLAPSHELTRLLGCRHRFDWGRGGWVPDRTEELETTMPGVFAVGDCAGIGGVEVAMAEAELVAGVIARRLRGTPAPRVAARRLRRLDRFRDALNAFYTPNAPLRPADDATILCRCEELTYGELRRAARTCDHDLAGLKAATRLSMGRCQGRYCLGPAADLLAAETERSPAEFTLPRSRPPARPVPIAHLLDEPLGPALAPDQVEPQFDMLAGGAP